MTSPLHIAVAARSMSFVIGGVGEYTRAMTRALLGLSSGHRFSIYYAEPGLVGSNPGAREVYLPAPHKFLWDHRALPGQLRRDTPDVVWYPHNVSSLGIRIPSVVTVHDLLYYPIPGFPHREYAWADTVYMRYFIRRSLRHATWIVADSSRTAFDLTRVLGVPTERIQTIYLAPSPCFRPVPASEIASARSRYGLGKPFFLYVGSLSVRKNARLLVEAFSRLKDIVPHDLVFAGGTVANSPQTSFDDLIHRYEIGDRVRRLGIVSQQDLVALYNAAQALVYPSLYEGFGLPPLEAFACGCPVICSNAASLPEVVGDAALTFNPHDATSLAAHLLEISSNVKLREQLKAEGACRVALFSFEKSAKQLLALLEDAAASSGPPR